MPRHGNLAAVTGTYDCPERAQVRDVVENKLRALVHGGTITLATVQQAATNSWAAAQPTS